MEDKFIYLHDEIALERVTITGSEFWSAGVRVSYAYKYGKIVVFNLQSRVADSNYIPVKVFTEIGRLSVAPRHDTSVISFGKENNINNFINFNINIVNGTGVIEAYNYSSTQAPLPYTNIVYTI